MRTLRNLTTLVLLSIVLFATAQQEISISLSGKITNPNSDKITISNSKGELVHTISVDETGAFKSKFETEEGYFSFYDQKEQTSIYLAKNYNLYITLKTDSFDESIRYSGKGSQINNYLVSKALMIESLGQKNYYNYFGKLSESDFLHFADSLNSASIKLLKSYKISNDQFLKSENLSLKLENIKKINIYPKAHKYLTGADEEVSDAYPDPYVNFPLNDPSLLNIQGYLSAIIEYATYERDSLMLAKAGDNTLYVLQSLNKKISNPKIKKEAMYSYCQSRITSSTKMEECYNVYQTVETNSDRLKSIEEKYLARLRTQKGAKSPSFSFEDLNGNMVTSEDLKGKLVYIDLWATWCGPCLAEIPYFDTLQETLKGKNITFVSICQKDSKERWKKTVELKNLKGLQLFAEGDGGQFYKEYQVNAIPRYILIDENGIIIDSDAKRPSNKALLVELENLLK